MFKRIGLFLVSNLAIIIVISFLLRIFNVEPYLTPYGLNYQSLLIYAAIIGVSGAFISLFLSKWLAKNAYSIYIISNPTTSLEKWLYLRVKVLAKRFNIGMPEVGIYRSREPNAFATGWNKNKALLAVSSGLLEAMDEEELEGVIGHELAHIANGDMVTMTLIQGVVNTFVIFFARVAAFFVAQVFRGNSKQENPVTGFAYFGIVILFEILFGILATIVIMWFSRRREFKADFGSAKQMGPRKMIRALEKLQSLSNAPVDTRGKAFATMKISHRGGLFSLFMSHPPLEERIEKLRSRIQG